MNRREAINTIITSSAVIFVPSDLIGLKTPLRKIAPGDRVRIDGVTGLELKVLEISSNGYRVRIPIYSAKEDSYYMAWVKRFPHLEWFYEGNLGCSVSRDDLEKTLDPRSIAETLKARRVWCESPLCGDIFVAAEELRLV